jgi:hypothetical protein
LDQNALIPGQPTDSQPSPNLKLSLKKGPGTAGQSAELPPADRKDSGATTLKQFGEVRIKMPGQKQEPTLASQIQIK